MIIDYIWIVFITTLTFPSGSYEYSQQFCSVFQPFKVSPENAKFQIGGIFPLHEKDCMHVRPSAVQELLATQWALSHWNRNPENADFRLAMAAADTCSRESQSLGQTVAFLNDAGYFSARECYKGDDRVPLGLIIPDIEANGMNSTVAMLRAVQLPLITYSMGIAQTMVEAQSRTIFSTAPTVYHYVEALTNIMKDLKSNHFTLIHSDNYLSKTSLDTLLSKITELGMNVGHVITLDELIKSRSVFSDIAVSILTKEEFLRLLSSSLMSLQRLYVHLPSNGDQWSRSEIDGLQIPSGSSAQILILRQASLFGSSQFRTYFLDILRNNYQSYALLASYMEQVYNCTLIGEAGMIDCADIDSVDLMNGYQENPAIESTVLATYAFAALSKVLATHPGRPCSKPGIACTTESIAYLRDRVQYTFTNSDPQDYRGFTLRFDEKNTVRNLKIEGLHIRNDAEFTVDIVMNYTVNGEWGFASDMIKWADGSPVVSWCEPWRPQCNVRACHTPVKKYKQERMWLQKPADLYLMGIFDMRRYDYKEMKCNNTIIDSRSLSMPASFIYTLETIRQKYPDFHLLPGLELGGVIVDACQDVLGALETVIATANGKCIEIEDPMNGNQTILSSIIAGFASGQSNRHVDPLKILFTDHSGIQRPLITASIGGTSLMPDYDDQARVLMELLLRQDWDYVSVVLSLDNEECVRAYEAFRRLVESDDRICISDVIRTRRNQMIESVKITASPSTPIVLAFTTAQDTALYLKTAPSFDDSDKPVYILIGEAHDWELESEEERTADEEQRTVPKWKSSLWGSVSLQLLHTVEDDFRTFLSTINPKRLPETWFIKFWEDYFRCILNQGGNREVCNGKEKLRTERFGRMTKEAYFMMGIEKFIFALDGVYKRACPERTGLCTAFFEGGYHQQLVALINGTPKADPQFVVYNYRPRTGEKTLSGGYVQIATWSSSEGLKYNDTWEYYESDTTSSINLPKSTCRPPLCRCKLENDFFNKPIQSGSSSEEKEQRTDVSENPEISKLMKSSGPTVPGHSLDIHSVNVHRHEWRKQPASYVFLVINTLLILVATLVLGLILYKLCYGVVKGNQSLGICLLFGVILLYCSVYFFIFDPDELMCRLRYISHSLAYSICFGVMITKAVQLKNSETVGYNGQVSYWNYWLLLSFIVAVQVALNMQWVALRDPVAVSLLVEGDAAKPSIMIHCSWTSEEFLASQIYVVLLLSLALFLAMMGRSVKRNYQETRWLMWTGLICAPVWLVWMIGYVLMPDPFKDTVMVMELITCATVILCFMFGPKLYILLSYEPAVVQYPQSGYKLGNGSLERNVDLTSSYNDYGALNFGDEEECQKSVVSATASTKSTSLSHTSSCASSITNASDDSLSVYQAVIRKKVRGKKLSDQQEGEIVGSVTPQLIRTRDTVLGETVASLH